MREDKYFLISGIVMLIIGALINLRWVGAVLLTIGFIFLILGAVFCINQKGGELL